jgi:hypothetical protein
MRPPSPLAEIGSGQLFNRLSPMVGHTSTAAFVQPAAYNPWAVRSALSRVCCAIT